LRIRGGEIMKRFTAILLLFVLPFLVLSQEKAEDYFKRGVENANKGKYDEAISDLKKALEISPKYAEYHFNLGVVYANKKQYDDAIKELEIAVSINQENIYGHYLLAMLYDKKKMKDKAIAEWVKVLNLNPDAELKSLAEKHIKRLKGE